MPGELSANPPFMLTHAHACTRSLQRSYASYPINQKIHNGETPELYSVHPYVTQSPCWSRGNYFDGLARWLVVVVPALVVAVVVPVVATG